VDKEKTQANMKAFAAVPGNLIDCDNGAYDKAYFTAQVAKGTLTTLALYNYAGYVLDGKLLRFCMTSDSITGEKVNCDDNQYWSPPEITESQGACHVFNPW